MESYSNHCLCSHLLLHSIAGWYRFLHLGQKSRKDRYSCTQVKYEVKNNVNINATHLTFVNIFFY